MSNYKSYGQLPTSSKPKAYNGPKAPEVTSIEEKKKYIQTNRICIFKVGASWCQPCVRIAPMIDELAHQLNKPGEIMIVSEDFDNKLSKDVMSVPIFEYYFEGKKVHRQHGADLTELKKNIDTMNGKS